MKIKIVTKNRSHDYRPKRRNGNNHTKYSMSEYTFEAPFTEKLSNTEAESKKCLAYTKIVYPSTFLETQTKCSNI